MRLLEWGQTQEEIRKAEHRSRNNSQVIQILLSSWTEGR
jgi:hypothetical protein